jgi:hypothetical protein
LALPFGQNLYPWDYEIYNIIGDLPALIYEESSFSYKSAVLAKIFENRSLSGSSFGPALGHLGVRVLKLTSYAPLSQ